MLTPKEGIKPIRLSAIVTDFVFNLGNNYIIHRDLQKNSNTK